MRWTGRRSWSACTRAGPRSRATKQSPSTDRQVSNVLHHQISGLASVIPDSHCSLILHATSVPQPEGVYHVLSDCLPFFYIFQASCVYFCARWAKSASQLKHSFNLMSPSMQSHAAASVHATQSKNLTAWQQHSLELFLCAIYDQARRQGVKSHCCSIYPCNTIPLLHICAAALTEFLFVQRAIRRGGRGEERGDGGAWEIRLWVLGRREGNAQTGAPVPLQC